jgi:ribosome recycling factor
MRFFTAKGVHLRERERPCQPHGSPHGLESVQKLIDDYSKKIEEIAASKEKEILER